MVYDDGTVNAMFTKSTYGRVYLNAKVGVLHATSPGTRSVVGRLVTRAWNAESQVMQH